MGYDCTLHAVDERQISDQFVEVILSGKPPEAGSAGELVVTSDLWEATFKSLAEDPPEIAASTLCQLALVFASKKHPYHYERGFAFCLWPEQTDVPAAELPSELTESPEALFKALLKQHPDIKGRFPLTFTGNWSTGTFIPAKKVPEALRWVERQVQRVPEGDRDLFRGLTLVLQYCAKRQLAYWEGTDLPVPMATMSVEGNEARRAERCFKWPDHGYEPLTQRGSMFVCSGCLDAGSKEARTALADFSTWPPTLDWIPEYVTSASFSSMGKLVTVAADPGAYFYDVRLRAEASSKAEVQRLPAEGTEPVGENGYEWAGFLGEQVVGLIQFKRGKTARRHLLFHTGAWLEAELSLRAPNDNHDDHWGGERIKVGFATTGAGAGVLIWDDGGFELINGKLQKTFSLASGPMWPWGRSTVPAGPDGFFHLADSRLFEAQRGAAPIQHLTKLTNIMAVNPGPQGSLLLKEGDNKAGDWGKLYWPEAGQIIRLTPKLLPDIARRDLRRMHWVEQSQRILFFADKEVWFVPWEEIKLLPKTKA